MRVLSAIGEQFAVLVIVYTGHRCIHTMFEKRMAD